MIVQCDKLYWWAQNVEFVMGSWETDDAYATAKVVKIVKETKNAQSDVDLTALK